MTVPNQMFTNAIDFLKGWPSQTAVDHVAKLSTNVTLARVPSGRVVHLNASHEFELGAKGTQVAIFTIPASDDYDVANPGNGDTDPYGWTSVAPGGNMSGLAATGSFELATTEFEVASGVTYNPNDLLHSPTEDQITGSDKSVAGKLFKRKGWPGGSNAALVLYTDSICAVVSRGAYANHYRRNVLAFWPVYLPSASA